DPDRRERPSMRRRTRVASPEQRGESEDADRTGRRAQQAERAGLGRYDRVHRLREKDVNGIARWMRLMLRDVEVPDAQCEVDRIEIFERRREIRQMEDEKNEGEAGNARLRGSRSFHSEVGRRNKPSFRLPMR